MPQGPKGKGKKTDKASVKKSPKISQSDHTQAENATAWRKARAAELRMNVGALFEEIATVHTYSFWYTVTDDGMW